MLLNKDESCLMLFNMQLDLVPLLDNNYQIAHDCTWLADLATVHEWPLMLIEHKQLGQILPSIIKVAKDANVLKKHHFSVTKEPNIMLHLKSIGRKQIVLAGAESHVCLLQSALMLQKEGFDVFVLSDAITARSNTDNLAAIERLKAHGCEMLTKEMLFFELIDNSELAHYMALSLKFLDGRYIT